MSVALISTMIVFSKGTQILSKRKNKRIRINLKKKYSTLSPKQKEIILQVLKSDDKTIALDKNSGDTIYLVNNLFLYIPDLQPVTLGYSNAMMLKFVPQPWLLDLYNEEPELFN